MGFPVDPLEEPLEQPLSLLLRGLGSPLATGTACLRVTLQKVIREGSPGFSGVTGIEPAKHLRL